MDCDTCREALSARLDGETTAASPDEHLATCEDCGEWYVAATALTGVWGAEPPAPDLAAAVLGRVEPRAGLLGTTRWYPMV